MKKNNTNKKDIPSKNYYIVLVVSILVIAITLYIRTIYLSYQINMENNSVFNDMTINSINKDDVDYALTETPEAILYVGFTGSKDIYNMEKKLKKEITKRNITDKIIYWNVTDLLDSHEYIKILREKYPDIASEINEAPLFIYINNNEGIEAVSSEIKMIDSKAFINLVEKYEIE